MQRVAIVSDTHIPRRATSIPDQFVDRIRGADHVIHAGDLTSRETLETVREYADLDPTVVRGNMDRGLDLPEVATLSVEGVTFVVTHGTGDDAGYEDRVRRAVQEQTGDVGVAGHTHEVLDTTVGGVRLLNPGSVTGAAPADRTTMMTADVEGGALDVSLHEI